MDEVAYFMDWDLEAVVRGCSSSTTTMEHPFIQLDGFISANNNNNNNNINLFAEDDEDNNMLFSSFAELSESTRVVDELEELYKPFYPSIISATAIVTANPQPTIIAKEEDNVKVKASSSSLSQKVVVAPPPQQLQQVIIPSSASASNKSKRRKKSVKKRVVKKVTAGCDAWAWRKYGQKPIKGSPYPRSYYRCSSSKGCLARKQVERNPVDPAVFLVTYTAEHNHPHPTRRNSLAGSTRIKTTNHNTTTTSSSSCAVRSLSPRTPLVVQSMDEQHNNNNDATTTTVVTTTSISSDEYEEELNL